VDVRAAPMKFTLAQIVSMVRDHPWIAIQTLWLATPRARGMGCNRLAGFATHYLLLTRYSNDSAAPSRRAAMIHLVLHLLLIGTLSSAHSCCSLADSSASAQRAIVDAGWPAPRAACYPRCRRRRRLPSARVSDSGHGLAVGLRSHSTCCLLA